MDEIIPAEPVDQPVNKQVEDEFVAESPRGIKPDEIIEDYFDPKYQEARAASNKKDQQDGDQKLTIGGNLGTRKIIKDHAKNILEYQHAGGEAAAEEDDYDIVKSSEYQHGGGAAAAEMDGYDVVETSGKHAGGKADDYDFVVSSEYQHGGGAAAAEMEGYDVVGTSAFQHAGGAAATAAGGYDCIESSKHQHGGSIAAGEADDDVFVDAFSSLTPAGSEDCSQE